MAQTRKGVAYWKVSPEVTAARKALGEKVGWFLRLARGDPRLSAWEEGFLASMQTALYRTKGQLELTEKQEAALVGIIIHLTEANEASGMDPEDDEPTC